MESKIKKICYFYIKHIKLIGFIYCAVPSIVWFVFLLNMTPFRDVYILRFLLCLLVASPFSAILNKKGVEMWLAKHTSNLGPATIFDGILVGAGIGIGSAILPGLTAFIYSTSHALIFQILVIVFVGVTVLGGVMGFIFSLIGRSNIDVNDKVAIGLLRKK